MAVGEELSDEELISLLEREGSIDVAVKHIYANYFYPVAGYIEQNHGSREDAEDNFQEVVLTFINVVKLGKFRGESSIKTFLYSISRNIWLNELKKRGRQEKRNKLFSNELVRNEANVQELISKREARKQVSDIIESLGDTCKKILLAFYYENLSIQEILLRLNYQNEQVVRNKKSKCMKSLEEKIGADPAIAKYLKSALQYE
jgi:RNA polymerase sigma factor (sigma-70 family)